MFKSPIAMTEGHKKTIKSWNVGAVRILNTKWKFYKQNKAEILVSTVDAKEER
jgi:hypothetical protein